MKNSCHSICRWTFHSGAGGFVPEDIRPSWSSSRFSTADMIRLVRERIAPRLPDGIVLGVEMHYDYEVNESDAAEVADALAANGIYLAMITPGAHRRFGYGGIASLDPKERKAAEEFGLRTVDLAYGVLRKAWHPHPEKAPSLVIWNGSFGYDLATPGTKAMYENLKESVAGLCRYEEKLGGELYIGIEPKPNEGHPAMLIPTVASALVFWNTLEKKYGVSRAKKGVNKEFGHSEMIGLDPVYDTVEELDNEAVIHMHLNSQGYSDGLVLGGPGKFDIDHGVRVNAMTVSIAGLVSEAGYGRWLGHDMQARAYDNEEQAVDRIVRSVIGWEACSLAAEELDTGRLMGYLAARETAKAEDIMRAVVAAAQENYRRMYGG